MALNSMIRKVPLLGNCDLTNFKTEIHDYEGFEQDNSFFLNKRKVNWWKRDVSSGEIGGGLSGAVNGEYFDVYKDNSFIGKVSRQYYKKESVSADAWRNETLQTVTNPYPADDNVAITVKNKIIGKNENLFVEQCGDYVFVADTSNSSEAQIKVYDSNNNLYDSFSIAPYNQQRNFSYVGFFYRASGYSFSYTFSSSWKNPTFSFNLPAGYVYINLQAADGAYKEAYIYNLATKELFFNSTLSYRWLTVDEGFTNFDSYASAYNSGAAGKRRVSIDYGYQYLYYDICAVNNNLYIQIYNWFSGYSTNELKLFFNSGLIDTRAPGQTQDPALGLEKGVVVANSEQISYNFKAYSDDEATAVYYERTYALPAGKFTRKIYNYSKKYGKWAVNFVNNEAKDIAHDYKKLFEIEGNEENGVVTAIDGYNDTYIYFHYGSDYYRISIATADNFADIVQSLNNVYFIFNTVSYLNAFYSGGNDWFCSCDDWNDRVQWYVNSDDYKDVQTTSRLNNNWQTLTDVVSVSDQIAPNLVKIAVTPDLTTLTAYDVSATWDGESIIYNSSGNVVDTSSWSYGDSLAGYYYAVTYISEPAKILPFYLDENYTCPEYLDENLTSKKQKYNVYFPVNPPYDSGATSLAKEGYLTVDGFTVQVDEGDEFTIPDSNSEYQRTPALCDTTYLVYTASVIIKNKGGNYTGLLVSSLGGIWTLIFQNKSETDPLQQGDAVFVINGVEYSYRAESNRILDFNGSYVCNTYLMKYVGFSTHCAYFYSEWDKAVYLFEGDNTLKKFVPLERYELAYSVYEDVAKIDVLNISSLDVVIVNLDTAILILFDSQYVIIETGKVNAWSIDETRGTFIVNGVMYSLVKSALNYGNVNDNEITAIPIKIETQFYGNPDNETNTINDCVYIKVDNLMSITSGSVKVKAVGLCNNKIVEAEEKTVTLRTEDFNSLSECLIKYQPKLQECKGFKLYIESDFEIAELKIGTSQGAINQTTKRI